MEYHKAANLLALLLLLGTGALHAAESGRIYRYIDDKGHTAFNSFIPAEFVKNGYAILNHKGQLLEEFPPQLTREDLSVQNTEEQYQRQRDQARQEADNMLLRLYRTPEDIERRRDLHLNELDTEIAAKVAELAQLNLELAEIELDSAEFAKQMKARVAIDTEVLTLTAKRENAAYGFKEDIERLKYLQRRAKDTAAN
jgi:hypothetical protein